MAILAQDTFTFTAGTDINSRSPDVGTGWTYFGTPVFLNNGGTSAQPTINTLNTRGGALMGTSPDLPADVDVQLKIGYGAVDTNYGIIARANAGAGNGYELQIDGPNDRLGLFSYASGTPTQIGSWVTSLGLSATNFTFVFSISGTTLVGKMNGVTKITETDSTYTAAGLAGMSVKSTYGSVQSSIVDDFQVDDASGGGSVPFRPYYITG
jgi:hypothetical protein